MTTPMGASASLRLPLRGQRLGAPYGHQDILGACGSWEGGHQGRHSIRPHLPLKAASEAIGNKIAASLSGDGEGQLVGMNRS
jgi:hypothetical protein